MVFTQLSISLQGILDIFRTIRLVRSLSTLSHSAKAWKKRLEVYAALQI